MKTSKYMHLPRVNQESNNNLVTQRMILSKRFNIKLLKNTASCLLSSIVAISILGIANKSVAQNPQDGNEVRPFIAVMRLNKKGEFLLIRREPTIVEKVKLPIGSLNEMEIEPRELENVVLKLKYLSRKGDGKFAEHLFPTTIVELDECGRNGWCRLRKIIYSESNLEEEEQNEEQDGAIYINILSRGYPQDSRFPVWVPSSNFCDIVGNAIPLINCSEPTIRMVNGRRIRNAMSNQ